MGLSSKQVSSDMNGWNQALLEGSKTIELPKTCPLKTQEEEDNQEPAPPQLNCPRCDSTNTKFCYYNNYNKSQPRHFCKACKRHWTKGGTLRNVPVGGGRKNKRLKTSKNATRTTTTTTNNTNNLAIQAQHLRVVSPFGGPSFPSSIVEDKTFSEAFYQTFLKPQHNSLPQSSITFNGNNNNEGFFPDSAIKTTSLGLSYQQHDDQDIQFPNSNNLGSFESHNRCSISSTITSIQSPILYNFTGDHTNNNDGLLENYHHQHQHQHQHQPWITMHTSSSDNNNNSMDMMSSSWGWDDFDKFVSVEADLTMPWDDSDIKP